MLLRRDFAFTFCFTRDPGNLVCWPHARKAPLGVPTVQVLRGPGSQRLPAAQSGPWSSPHSARLLGFASAAPRRCPAFARRTQASGKQPSLPGRQDAAQVGPERVPRRKPAPTSLYVGRTGEETRSLSRKQGTGPKEKESWE